jgi:hypothetical protein
MKGVKKTKLLETKFTIFRVCYLISPRDIKTFIIRIYFLKESKINLLKTITVDRTFRNIT